MHPVGEYQQVAGQPRPKKTQIQHMCRGALPLDRSGTVTLPKLPERDLVSQYLGHKHVSEEILSEHFSAMFQQFLTSLASKDYQSLEKLTEQRFLNQLKSKSDDLGKFQLNLQIII